MRLSILPVILVIFFISSCEKEKNNTSTGPKLVLKFKFDPTQGRLNNIGQPQPMPAGHAGQSPAFNTMSAHYVELTPTAITALGGGAVLYRAPETNAGGTNAIDFDKSKFAGNNETFFLYH